MWSVWLPSSQSFGILVLQFLLPKGSDFGFALQQMHLVRLHKFYPLLLILTGQSQILFRMFLRPLRHQASSPITPDPTLMDSSSPISRLY